MALSPYELSIKKARAEKEKQSEVASQVRKHKKEMADIEARLSSIRGEVVVSGNSVMSTKAPSERITDDKLLVICTKCNHSYSKKAEKCPKCNTYVLTTCLVCKKNVPLNSSTCPECGDPDPFNKNDSNLCSGMLRFFGWVFGAYVIKNPNLQQSISPADKSLELKNKFNRLKALFKKLGRWFFLILIFYFVAILVTALAAMTNVAGTMKQIPLIAGGGLILWIVYKLTKPKKTNQFNSDNIS